MAHRVVRRSAERKRFNQQCLKVLLFCFFCGVMTVMEELLRRCDISAHQRGCTCATKIALKRVGVKMKGGLRGAIVVSPAVDPVSGDDVETASL